MQPKYLIAPILAICLSTVPTLSSSAVAESSGPVLTVQDLLTARKNPKGTAGEFRLFRVTLGNAPAAKRRGINLTGTQGFSACYSIGGTATSYSADCWVLPTSPVGSFTLVANGFVDGARVATRTLRLDNIAPKPGQIDAVRARSNLMCGNRTSNVWLTFDDGYISAANARRLSAILEKNDIRGRFFFIGDWSRTPTGKQVVAYLKSRGHIIQNHTKSHPKLTALSSAAILAQVRGGPVSSARPAMLRPPYGDGWNSARVNSLIQRAGYQVCYWSVDTRDWAGASAAEMYNRVRYGDATTPPASPGSVVLMHVNHFSEAKLKAVIRGVRERSLTFDRL